MRNLLEQEILIEADLNRRKKDLIEVREEIAKKKAEEAAKKPDTQVA